MKKVSLTISGGGVRSIAGLGVLKYLEEIDVDVVELSGNSGGAILALLYSYGLSIDEIHKFTEDIEKLKLFKPSFSSFFSLLGLEEQFNELLKDRVRKKSLTVVTTNIDDMVGVYHSKGDLIRETIASSSVYYLFPTIILDDGKNHTDGLYVDNMPNKHLVNKKIKNISINVNNPSLEQKPSKRIYKIRERAAIEYNASQADCFIDFIELANIRLLDLSKFNYCIDQGYKRAKEELKDFDFNERE